MTEATQTTEHKGPSTIAKAASLGMAALGSSAAGNHFAGNTVDHADHGHSVARWVADILSCAPLSLRAIKQVARRTAHLTAQEAQAARLPAVVAALRSKDSEEGVRAFVEKRKPMWRGE